MTDLEYSTGSPGFLPARTGNERLRFTAAAPADVPKGGYLYIAAFGPTVKIGRSRRPAARLNTLFLQAGVLDRVALFSQFLDDPVCMETAAHHELASFRVHGEHFALPLDDAHRRLGDLFVKIEKIRRGRNGLDADAMLDRMLGHFAHPSEGRFKLTGKAGA